MLKRTKSANKSVISDAIDNDNTAVTLAGPSQPDEDDYGYVSQEASAYYNKMMQKYNTTPDEEKFSKSKKNTNTNLKEIKDRVRAALLKEQEDALLPHKRKRKPKEDGGDLELDYKEERMEPERKEKPKPRPAPPPLNFNDLLKIAEKKQFEPIRIEPKIVEKEERPMTKKQKREFEKELAWKERKEKGLPTDSQKMPPPNKIPKLSNSTNNGRIPKLSNSEDRQKIPKVPNSSSSNSSNSSSSGYSSSSERPIPSKLIPKKSDIDRNTSKKLDDRPKNNISKRPDDKNNVLKRSDNRPDPNKVSKLRTELEKNRSINVNKSSSSPRPTLTTNNQNLNRSIPSNSKSSALSDKNKALVRKDIKPKQFPPSDLKPKQFPPSDLRPKKFPPSDLKPKQFPPSDLRPKQFPPADVRPKFPSKNVKRKPMGNRSNYTCAVLNTLGVYVFYFLAGRILDEDDSEYDSEMDDFIDDGTDGQEDYSKYISEIFGYDKSRYRNESYDDAADMESSFSQVMKEEFISGKLGIYIFCTTHLELTLELHLLLLATDFLSMAIAILILSVFQV